MEMLWTIIEVVYNKLFLNAHLFIISTKIFFKDSRSIRIMGNPMNLNYSDPDDAILQATSFDNPNHIQLPSGYTIDSSTYNKRDRRSKHK